MVLVLKCTGTELSELFIDKFRDPIHSMVYISNSSDYDRLILDLMPKVQHSLATLLWPVCHIAFAM